MVWRFAGLGSLISLAVALVAPVAVAETAGNVDASSDDSSATRVASKPAFLLGAAIGVGLFKGPAGPWGEVGIGGDLPLTSTLELRGTLTGFVSRHTRGDSADYHQWGVEEDNEDDLLSYGGIARLALALDLGGAWRARFGPLVGFAHVSVDSTQCGSASLDRAFWGFSLGPSYRLGNVEFSATGELMTFPFMACTNGGTSTVPDQPAPMLHVRDELSFDDPTILITLGASYRWH